MMDFGPDPCKPGPAPRRRAPLHNLSALLALPLVAQTAVVRALPERPRIELGKSAQHLNFDFLLANPGQSAVERVGVEG